MNVVYDSKKEIQVKWISRNCGTFYTKGFFFSFSISTEMALAGYFLPVKPYRFPPKNIPNHLENRMKKKKYKI